MSCECRKVLEPYYARHQSGSDPARNDCQCYACQEYRSLASCPCQTLHEQPSLDALVEWAYNDKEGARHIYALVSYYVAIRIKCDACESPVRKALEACIMQHDRYCEAPLCGDTIVNEARAALSVPCPCEGLREKVDFLSEQLADAILARQSEREQLRVENERLQADLTKARVTLEGLIHFVDKALEEESGK